jgi:hypothetical protein
MGLHCVSENTMLEGKLELKKLRNIRMAREA